MSKRTLVDAERLSQKIKAYMRRNNKKKISITRIGDGFDFVCTPDMGFSLIGEFENIARAAVMYIMENNVYNLTFTLKGDKLHTVELNAPQAAVSVGAVPVLPYNVCTTDYIKRFRL